jgi:RES domain-containing protein
MFNPLIELYREAEYGEDYYEDSDPPGENLPDKIYNDWEIFSELFDYEKLNDFWEELVNYNNGSKDLEPINLYGFWIGDEELDYSIDHLWEDLSNHLKKERRFIISNERIENILSRLPVAIERTYRNINVGKKFYRARLGPDNADEFGKAFTPKQMGMPPPDRTPEGRANPFGIPFLYLASELSTAISEVRPWKGAYVSVATFESKEELRLVDLADDFSIHDPFGILELNFVVEDNILLRRLSKELSEPINPNKSRIEYIPSQFLTEIIRDEGYQGIIYPSALGSGQNIVLFDDRLVKCKSVKLYFVNEIQYEFSKRTRVSARSLFSFKMR